MLSPCDEPCIKSLCISSKHNVTVLKCAVNLNLDKLFELKNTPALFLLLETNVGSERLRLAQIVKAQEKAEWVFYAALTKFDRVNCRFAFA
jgi:hypothetical protein